MKEVNRDLSDEELKLVVEGYQTLFRSILSGLKQMKGEELTMREVKPYLLYFENPFPNTSVSIFPSNEIRRQYVDAAFALFNEGKHEIAKAGFLFLTRVIDKDPNVLLGYGTCLLLTGNHEEAALYFEKSEALLPGNLQATVLKIRAFKEQGSVAAAQAALRSAIDDAIRQSDQESRVLLEMVGERLGLRVGR